MAWSAPKTWTAEANLTASELNTQVRDNLLMTATAQDTSAPSWAVTASKNAVAMRQIKEVIATPQVSTTSTSPVSLSGGPSISVSHGGALLVLFSARIHRTSDMSAVYAGPQINGKPKGAVNTSTAIA